FQPEIRGQVFNDINHDGVHQPGERGVAGRQIQLKDETGAVIATTRTDRNGFYRFDLFSGLGLGTYTVVEVLPRGTFQTTANPAPITITRGAVLSGVDFGNSRFRGPGTAVTPTVTPGLEVQTEAEFAAYVSNLINFWGQVN